MFYDSRRIAGTLLVAGSVQWFLIIMLSEGLHPGYNSSVHYVSSLGVGPTALMYNISLVLLGLTVAVGAYLTYEASRSRLFFILLTITGIATMGVGLFPENMQPTHGIVTPIALLFGAASAIVSYRLLEPPLSYISITLGALSFGAGILFNPYLGLPPESLGSFLGLTKGTMERMVIYPILLWTLGFGSALASPGSQAVEKTAVPIARATER